MKTEKIENLLKLSKNLNLQFLILLVAGAIVLTLKLKNLLF